MIETMQTEQQNKKQASYMQGYGEDNTHNKLSVIIMVWEQFQV